MPLACQADKRGAPATRSRKRSRWTLWSLRRVYPPLLTSSRQWCRRVKREPPKALVKGALFTASASTFTRLKSRDSSVYPVLSIKRMCSISTRVTSLLSKVSAKCSCQQRTPSYRTRRHSTTWPGGKMTFATWSSELENSSSSLSMSTHRP